MARPCQSGRYPDCESGKWGFGGWEFDAFGLIGLNIVSVIFKCVGGDAKCKFRYWCFTVGMGGSRGIQAVGGYVTSTEKGGCQCAEDLSGWSVNFGVGGGPSNFPIIGGSLEGIFGSECIGVQGGTEIGPSLYLAAKPCKFTKLWCK